jgi:hypothetical protein
MTFNLSVAAVAHFPCDVANAVVQERPWQNPRCEARSTSFMFRCRSSACLTTTSRTLDTAGKMATGRPQLATAVVHGMDPGGLKAVRDGTGRQGPVHDVGDWSCEGDFALLKSRHWDCVTPECFRVLQLGDRTRADKVEAELSLFFFSWPWLSWCR